MAESRKTPEAERGTIYRFFENNGKPSKNHALVISDNSRAMDRFVSVLILNEYDAGADVVKVDIQGKTYYAHCGMVSYASRERLGAIVCVLDEGSMEEIDARVAEQLGLEKRTGYKELYEELIEKILDRKETLI
jgi:hypothetical protein